MTVFLQMRCRHSLYLNDETAGEGYSNCNPAPSICHSGNQVSQFAVDVGRVGDRACNFFPEQLAVASSKAVGRHFDSPFAQSHGGADLAVSLAAGFSFQHGTEAAKEIGFAGRCRLGLQSSQHDAEQIECPLSLVNSLWRLFIGKISRQANLCFDLVNPDRRPAATTNRGTVAVARVRKVVSACGAQEGSKSPAMRIGNRQVAALDQICQETLHQVGGIMLSDAAPAHEGVEGIPVVAAEPLERVTGRWIRGVAGMNDTAPACRRELDIRWTLDHGVARRLGDVSDVSTTYVIQIYAPRFG
jgi:hypothetical protein